MFSYYSHVAGKYLRLVLAFSLSICIGGSILILGFGAVLTPLMPLIMSIMWLDEELSFKRLAIAILYLLVVSPIAYPWVRKIVENFNPRNIKADDFRVRIVPYFENAVAEKVGGRDHPFFYGRKIAKNLRRLDSYTRQGGARPLSSFGFKDDKIGEKVRWHDSNVGLLTVDIIVDCLQEQNRDRSAKKDFEVLITELKLVRDWLQKASEANVRFALLTRMEHETELSWSGNRKGSFT